MRCDYYNIQYVAPMFRLFFGLILNSGQFYQASPFGLSFFTIPHKNPALKRLPEKLDTPNCGKNLHATWQEKNCHTWHGKISTYLTTEENWVPRLEEKKNAPHSWQSWILPNQPMGRDIEVQYWAHSLPIGSLDLGPLRGVAFFQLMGACIFIHMYGCTLF